MDVSDITAGEWVAVTLASLEEAPPNSIGPCRIVGDEE
jgi:hypothetical protein